MNRSRLLFAIAGVLLAAVAVKYGFLDRDEQVVKAQASVPAMERRLDRIRAIAAAVPGKEDLFRKSKAELEESEKGLLAAENQQQAQVALLQAVQDTARANQIEIRGSQEFRQQALNADYGEVAVGVTFTCGIEQLVNFLAALGNQPAVLATDQIHISGGGDKKKNLQVRMSVSTVVPRKLIAGQKGAAGF